MGLKNTIKMVKKVLNDPEKRRLYSEAEILYMEMEVKHMKLVREQRKQQRKQKQGFGYGKRETHQPHDGSRGA